jgi:apolipoprotein N-acyltransferase
MKNMNIHLKLSGLSLLTGLLLTLAWPAAGLFPLALVGLIPLFYAHYLIQQEKLNAVWAFLYGYVAFLTFNLGTTWWVWNASAGGAVMAFILNSLLMNLPFMFWYFYARRQQNRFPVWPFICAWLVFEYFHYRWEGTWTWLTLGNAFANVPWLVQWYEYTGVGGGTLWILWVNKSIFQWLVAYQETEKMQRRRRIFNLVFFLLVAPALLSFYTGLNQVHITTRLTSRVMVVQPNIDPYKDKFDGLSPYEQVVRMLNIAEQHMDSAVQLVMFPETALVGNLDERFLEQEETITLLRQFMAKHPNVSIVTGADTYKSFQPGEKLSETARLQRSSGVYYDSYNTALVFKAGDTAIGVYHKSKLVPGVERMPLSFIFKYIEAFAIDLGGTSGSLGTDPEPSCFEVNSQLNVAPIICYESIFGEYVTEYVKRGATLLCIVTNDGWWGNTPGYKQHLDYARLRAIETRRYVARSANTGISAFIDDYGNVLAKTGWWEPAALKYNVGISKVQTFYVQYGDLINKVAIVFTVFFLFQLLRTPKRLM